MNSAAFDAWISLYAAVGLLVAMCTIAASVQTAHEIITGAWRPEPSACFGNLLIVPKVWLRWQINYLRGFPAILAIALIFAWHLDFDLLGSV